MISGPWRGLRFLEQDDYLHYPLLVSTSVSETTKETPLIRPRDHCSCMIVSLRTGPRSSCCTLLQRVWDHTRGHGKDTDLDPPLVSSVKD